MLKGLCGMLEELCETLKGLCETPCGYLPRETVAITKGPFLLAPLLPLSGCRGDLFTYKIHCTVCTSPDIINFSSFLKELKKKENTNKHESYI